MEDENKNSQLSTSQSERKKKQERIITEDKLINIKAIALQSMDLAVVIADMEGNIIFANKACRNLWGYSEENEITDKNIFKFLAKENLINSIASATQRGNKYVLEDKSENKDGIPIDIQVTLELIKSQYGKPVGILACIIDSTEKKRLEEISVEKQYLVDNFLNHTDDIAWRCSIDGKEVISINDSFEIVYGHSSREFIANPDLWIEAVHPDDRAIALESGKEVHQNGKSTVEYRIVRPDGEIRWLLDKKSVIKNSKGIPVEIGGFATDITKYKKLEKEILLVKEKLEQQVKKQTVELINSQEQLRALALHLQNVREEERTSISRDIHDDLGSHLTLFKNDIEEIIENNKLVKSVNDQLISLIDRVNAVNELLRKIANKLRPPVLDHFGLIPAMEWQIQQFQLRSKTEVNHEFSLKNFPFNDNASTTIFRIFQEILTNILRHSNATCIDMLFVAENEKIILKVRDNGVGFNTMAPVKANSFGLLSMMERAKSIGGELIVDSIPGTGTTITLLLIKHLVENNNQKHD